MGGRTINFYLICVIMTFGEIDRKSVAKKMRAPVTLERINDKAVYRKMHLAAVAAVASGMPTSAGAVVEVPEAVVMAAAGGIPSVAPPVVEAPGVVMPALAGAEPQVVVASVAGRTPTLAVAAAVPICDPGAPAVGGMEATDELGVEPGDIKLIMSEVGIADIV